MSNGTAMSSTPSSNLPNLLTLSRIGVLPLLIAAFYVPAPAGPWIALALFVAAGVTDYFDGYVARARNVVSPFGRMLDPIADKLLVAAVLLLLAARDGLSLWLVVPALVILGREILVSGLREFLAGAEVTLHVTRLAKWKTTVQMVALGVLIVAPAFAGTAVPAMAIGLAGLWLAALLTAVTGHAYLRATLAHIRRDGS
jgi:cardiolipin synthase